MHKFFIDAWEQNKGKLKDYFKTHKQEEYGSYESILQRTIQFCFDNYKDINFNYERTKTIDFGDYQGTLLLFFTKDDYQPDEDETYITSVSYGSCSGCDTLQAICSWDDEQLPNEQQLNDYMTLALHLVQHIKCVGDNDSIYF